MSSLQFYQTLFIASLAPTIAAAAAFIQGRINSRKADTIHVLVNSNLTEIRERLAGALKEIEFLKAELVKKT